jgi:2-C-methyl-D-erythritol 4-phosphate cytidylyltransferase / 2-C-methyl-D-erythritol 2,4-cyclodiphosphate synthase
VSIAAIAAIVVAAGDGSRFGARKQFALLEGRSVAARAVAAARSVATTVVLVVPSDAADDAHGADLVVVGGATRSASVRAGLAALDPKTSVVVVHDAARPLASPQLFRAVVEALDPDGGVVGAIPGVRLTDTVKRLDPSGHGVAATLVRDELVAVQTPQAFVARSLRDAHADDAEGTDDASLVEAHGGKVAVVEGESANLKLTDAHDLAVARASLRAQGPSMRVGHGHDVHRFSDDPGRPLVLGGVRVPDAMGLEGHSDADVATHALCDAVLGAACLGDLGRHFPDDDPTHLGVSSTSMLARCCELARDAGFAVSNADVTVVAQVPRLASRLAEMSSTLTAIVGAPVSVKATTTEGLGAIGRGEGIAATAAVLLVEGPAT